MHFFFIHIALWHQLTSLFKTFVHLFSSSEFPVWHSYTSSILVWWNLFSRLRCSSVRVKLTHNLNSTTSITQNRSEETVILRNVEYERIAFVLLDEFIRNILARFLSQLSFAKCYCSLHLTKDHDMHEKQRLKRHPSTRIYERTCLPRWKKTLPGGIGRSKISLTACVRQSPHKSTVSDYRTLNWQETKNYHNLDHELMHSLRNYELVVVPTLHHMQYFHCQLQWMALPCTIEKWREKTGKDYWEGNTA